MTYLITSTFSCSARWLRPASRCQDFSAFPENPNSPLSINDLGTPTRSSSTSHFSSSRSNTPPTYRPSSCKTPLLFRALQSAPEKGPWQRKWQAGRKCRYGTGVGANGKRASLIEYEQEAWTIESSLAAITRPSPRPRVRLSPSSRRTQTEHCR